MHIKIILSALLMLTLNPAAKQDYRAVFGTDYIWANDWVKEHNTLFANAAQLNNVPARELEAIVFPELIRYNNVYDAMEIQSLKFLYVSNGKAYADFSVGCFQMKPSFAEAVEKDAVLYLDDSTIAQLSFQGLAYSKDDEATRKQRVQRITSVAGQLNYLVAFYKICERKFETAAFTNSNEKIKFFATAYNAGYHFTKEEILKKADRRFFHTGKLLSATKYNYSDIAMFWFGIDNVYGLTSPSDHKHYQ